MNDLKRLITFDESREPRYFVRSVGSPIESDHFNTWRTLGDAERYRAGMRELNPGVEFEIIDLVTGEPIKPAHAFRNDEDGTESRIWPRADGGWNVVLHDLGAGETLPSGMIFASDREADAIEYAKGIVEPFCACGRRVSDCDRSRKGCAKP